MESNNQVAVSKTESLKMMLASDSVMAQFKNALGDNTAPFTASLMELFASDSNLQSCSPAAIVKEALKAAILKLPVIKSLGQAYIIPYKKGNDLVPQFQIGYKGLVQLAIRTQQYRILNADVVYKGEYRTRNKMTGEFDLNGEATSDEVIGYFAHFELQSGFSKTLFMTREKVDAHAKKYSKSYNQAYSPWKTEFDKMGIKTVLSLLLTHWGFLSPEMMQAMDSDDITDKVRDEINSRGNKQPMDFQQAEIVNEPVNGHQSNFQQSEGPGF